MTAIVDRGLQGTLDPRASKGTQPWHSQGPAKLFLTEDADKRVALCLEQLL